MTLSIIFLVALALLFDFLNGFHDSANSIATIVSTRVLTPQRAVIWAAFFNFIAFIFLGLHVADTIGKIIKPEYVDIYIIFATLIGACIWDILTWWFGLPTSSSHALIGGMIGAAVVKGVSNTLVISSLLNIKAILKTVLFIFVSPIVGLILGLLIGTLVMWIFRKASPIKVDHIFRKGQLVSAALYSLGHGGNDAQKTMGIIFVLLMNAGLISVLPTNVWNTNRVEFLVIISCQIAIALGTMFGGWRIVKTMGQRVTKLRPVDGFCAETGAAISLFIATLLGAPVSTTHTITGAIMGVGSLKRMSAVRWGVAGKIIWAWILTIPGAAVISAITYALVR
ncbi:MAG TPA: inorganic phosphate transporter [Desulfomonilia bacterium]